MLLEIHNQDMQPDHQRTQITSSHFGSNLLITNIPTGSATFSASGLPSAISFLGATSLRYPGGSVTEQYFSMENPNNTRGGGNGLIPQSEFLSYCSRTGAEANMVIPTVSGFLQSAAQALLSGQYGNRVISNHYLETVEAYVKQTMLEAAALRPPTEIKSFEIGNEFWGSGQMTAAEYGRLAAAVLRASEAGINAAIAVNPEVASMHRPELVVQSLHTTGGFSPNEERQVHVANGVVYSNIADIPTNEVYSTVTMPGQGSVAEQRGALAASLNNAEIRRLIDGITDHAYARQGFAGIDTASGESYVYFQIDQFERAIGAQPGSLQRYITEWNTDHTSGANNQGLAGAAMLTEIFYEMATHNIQNANIWPLIFENHNENNLLRGASPHQTVSGAMFRLMQESLIGTVPVLDSNVRSNAIELDIHGFKSSSSAVLFISNRSAGVANGITLDLNTSNYNFEHALNTTQYFITTTQLSAVNSAGYTAHGNDGVAVTSVLTYSNGRVQTNLRSGDLVSFSNLASFATLRVEITFITTGADRIEGRSGNDVAFGAAGPDVLMGNEGNDSLSGGLGDDFVGGGAGSDILMGDGGVDVIDGGPGNDILSGGLGVDILIGGAGSDILRGDSGSDTASYKSATTGVSVSLLAPSTNTGDARGDIYISIENFIGSRFSDRLVGDSNANIISGDAGDDTIIYSGGPDTIYGGSGCDTVVFNCETPVSVSLFGSNNSIGVLLSEVENIISGAGSDEITGDWKNNVLIGNDGNDTLSGYGGDDSLLGGAGTDLLWGLEGQDTMIGGSGNDTLGGGAHFDLLTGGTGNDVFQYNKPEQGGDTITDFCQAGYGNDDRFMMNVAGFGGGLSVGVLLADQFVVRTIGNSGMDNRDRFVFNSSDDTLWFDSDGIGGYAPVLIARLSNFKGDLAAEDIWLL